MNQDLSFAEPVMMKSSGRVHEVRDARQAYDALNGEWPQTRAKWYYAAKRACSSAMEGRTGPQVARRIFLEAVKESRLHG